MPAHLVVLVAVLLNTAVCGSVVLREPSVVLPDSNGVTSVTLRVTICRNTIETSSELPWVIEFTSRVYSTQPVNGGEAAVGTSLCGNVPGPTLVVVPGGTLNVTVVNHLTGSGRSGHHVPGGDALRQLFDGAGVDAATEAALRANVFHKINSTNLHVHGMHVDPRIDDPFRLVSPGAVAHYVIPVPRNHRRGVHWFHPHIHGSVAMQMMGGMFGVILVEGALGNTAAAEEELTGNKHMDGTPAAVPSTVTHVSTGEHNFREHVLDTLRQRAVARRNRAETFKNRHVIALHLLKFADKSIPSPHAGWSFSELDEALRNVNVPSNPSIRSVDIMAVNGQFQPLLRVVAREPFVLHMIHASPTGEPRLVIPPSCAAAVLAADGYSYNKPRRVRHVRFTSATRIDLLMECMNPGLIPLRLDFIDFNATTPYFASVRSLPGLDPTMLMKLHVTPAANNLTNRADEAAELDPLNETAQPVAQGSLAHWHFLHRVEKEHFTSRVVSMRTGIEDLRGDSQRVRPALRWDVSMSQHELKLPIAINSSDSASSIKKIVMLQQLKQYVLGSGINCDPLSRDGDRQCTFEAFQGRRGANITLYNGFVAKEDDVIELRLFGDPYDPRPHPMHFHVNHFQLVSVVPLSDLDAPQAQHLRRHFLEEWGLEAGDWRDTIPVHPRMRTTVRWRASDFSGEVVYHCHTASHEDRGMMASYFIAPRTTQGTRDPAASGGTPGSIPFRFDNAASAMTHPQQASTSALVLLALWLPLVGVLWLWYRSIQRTAVISRS